MRKIIKLLSLFFFASLGIAISLKKSYKRSFHKPSFKIAILTKNAPNHNIHRKGFLEELAKCHNIKFDVSTYYTTEMDKINATAIVEEALENGADILVPIGLLLAQISKNVTEKRNQCIPIVFIGVRDPVEKGLMQSEESSGNHITGVRMGPEDQLQPARLLNFLKPHIKHLVLIYCPLAGSGEVEKAAYKTRDFFIKKKTSVTLLPVEKIADVLPKVKGVISSCDAILNFEGCISSVCAEGISKLCNQYKVTFFAGELSVVQKGAAAGFAADFSLSGAKAFSYVHKILCSGIKPTNIPLGSVDYGRRVLFNAQAAKKQNLFLSKELIYCLQRGVVFDDIQ